MPGTISQDKTRNRVLAHLSAGDFELLAPALVPVDMPVRKQLESRNKPIEHVYFIEHGLASMVANGMGEKSIEVGVIGYEGMTGLPVLMATDRSPNETFMQSAGNGQCMSVADLRTAIGKSETLHHCLLRYSHAVMVQMAYTALANGRGKLEERLARWLLMAHDRADGDELALTHEFLAVMLGVRRPGVTTALNLLEKQALIGTRRGIISILDREGLKESANGAYGIPETEFHRLFGQ